MDETLRIMLAGIKGREGEPQGIRTAYDFIRTVKQCANGHCSKFGLRPSELNKALKEGRKQLVYGDDGMEVLRNVSDTMPASLEKSFADAQLGPTHMACADFPAIITSTREDRDGDVLESKGASIDPKSPLLLYHVPTLTVGKHIALLEQTDKRVKSHLAIADTELGKDTAVLAEFGALRISHGFFPTEYEERKSGSGKHTGFHVKKFKIVEVSLVSIPSNEDAEITAFSRNKLTTPFFKELAKGKFDKRAVQVTGGFDAKHVAEIAAELAIKMTDQKHTDCKCNQQHGKATDDCVSAKVKVLMEEGKTQEQAVAMAMKHCGESDKSKVTEIAAKVYAGQQIKGKVVEYAKHPKADVGRAWDGQMAVSRLRQWSGVNYEKTTQEAWDKYAKGFAYVSGDGTKLSDYKLPHHDIINGMIVTVWKGIASAMGAVNGAMGVVKFDSDSDKKKVYDHLAQEYALFEKEPPEMKDLTPEQMKDALTKGMYAMVGDALSGSWEETLGALRDGLQGFAVESKLIHASKAGEYPSDYCYVMATFDNYAVICARTYDDAGNRNEEKYYRVSWSIVDDEPQWLGEPKEVMLVTTIEDAEKQYRDEAIPKSLANKNAVALLESVGNGSKLASELRKMLRAKLKALRDCEDEEAIEEQEAELEEELEEALNGL